jgi:hypothetical protein
MTVDFMSSALRFHGETDWEKRILGWVAKWFPLRKLPELEYRVGTAKFEGFMSDLADSKLRWVPGSLRSSDFKDD